MDRPAKFNLSFKRIFFRFSLTFLLGILFGLAMLPFLQEATGLYDGQQAAIGAQNMLRMVVLWGLFTLVFSLIAFGLKRFRMTSVLLIICWLVSILVYILANVADSPASEISCARPHGYPSQPEFTRALGLISQRLAVTDKVDTYISLAFQFSNCINIQYSNEESLVGGSEGVFVIDDPSLQNLKIFVNSSYKSFDDLTLATILVHELNHVGRYINSVNSTFENNCFDDETDSFLVQDIFISAMNAEEVRSIYVRLRENAQLNPAFTIVLLFDQINTEVSEGCKKIQETNALDDSQFRDCQWQGIGNRLDQEVRNSETYKSQCAAGD